MEYNENSYYPGQSPGVMVSKRKKPQNRGFLGFCGWFRSS